MIRGSLTLTLAPNNPPGWPRNFLSCRIQETKKPEARASGLLTELERQVVKMRYGLDDGYTYSLEEVGQRLEITAERVREIETEAVAKLRSS